MSVQITKSYAESIVGSLSKPSKMPGHAYGISAKRCITGSALAKVPNSVCSKCYALKGRYTFPNVVNAHEKRFESLANDKWVELVTFLIRQTGDLHFRWHDSGDLQGVWHLEKIVEVAKNCPEVQFWLPTREKQIVFDYLRTHNNFPKNLVVRVSAAMIDGPAPAGFSNTSTVVTKPEDATCVAPKQQGVCGFCRACWDPEVANVAYLKH